MPLYRSTSRRRILLIAGVDEAGRGPLAGPVVAAAVVLNPRWPLEGLRDSKQLTAALRNDLAEQIRAQAVAFAVGQASVSEIDRLNILRASLLAMRRAIEALHPQPDLVLVDGTHLPLIAIAARAIVGGDASEPSISAASILAKTHRDKLMVRLHEKHPQYGFDRHFGYPTPQHLRQLRRLGPCPVHRRSFAPVRELLSLKLDC
ncbi:MAG: ribonuclease HII [Burkholderiaceae bacterium]|nr:ribonuclease HII [Burkholderiaceae bacterium]